MKFPFLSLDRINAPWMAEIEEATARVVRSGRYIGGPENERLETNLRDLTGAPYAVGVSNGLDALRLILEAWKQLGRLHPGDKVIVPANTYVASVLAIAETGLVPVLAEPSLSTLNLDTAILERYLTPKVKAIMPVHLYGRVCWDDDLKRFAEAHNLLVIEDNAQAIGAVATVDGLFGSRAAGALGHAGAFSFYPTKNLGALGDAGAVVTHDPELAAAVRALANYGSDRRYHNIYVGYNCRLDPMQAAILNVKFPHLAAVGEQRRDVAAVYDREITNPAVVKPLLGGDDNVWHQYPVMVGDRDGFRSYLEANGVGTDVHYATPPHRQPCFASLAHSPLPLTEQIAAQIVSLPIAMTSEADAAEIAAIINAYKG